MRRAAVASSSSSNTPVGSSNKFTSNTTSSTTTSSTTEVLLPPPTPQLVATVKRNKCGTAPFDEHWLNLDCCGLVCALLTYALHLYGIYAVCFILLPPWMSIETTIHAPPETTTTAAAAAVSVAATTTTSRVFTLAGHFHRFCFTAIAMLACYAHFKAMTTDPGAVPPDALPLPDPDDDTDDSKDPNNNNNNIIISPVQRGKRLCRRCKSFKPQRAHHCSVCKRCIIKMDHHCPWVNNCVGIGNHKYFLLFVFYTFLSCIYSMTLVVFRFVLCMNKHSHKVHCLDRPTDLLSILGLVVEAMLFGLFTSCMMVDQWDVVMSNVTHIDRLKGESGGGKHGKIAGVIEVFGVVKSKTWSPSSSSTVPLAWLSPFAAVCFPSGRTDEILGYCRPCPKGPSDKNGTEMTVGVGSGGPGNGNNLVDSTSGGASTSNRLVKGVAEIV